MGRDFERFATLDDESLRRVLDGGDAPARLHALWALASRHGAQTLTAQIGQEPSPGVRRHACVLLAGADVDLLVHFARLDPDPGVRGTASTFVTRLAVGGRLPWALVTEKLDDPAAQRAVLEALGGAPPPEVVRAAGILAAADDREVASAALQALWLVARESALCASVVTVARPDLTEGVLAIWAEHAELRSIHEALRSAPVAARLAAIRRGRARWADLSPLALDDDARIRSAVREALIHDLSAVPVDVLAAWIDDGSKWWRHLGQTILQRLRSGEVLAHPEELLDRARRELASRQSAAASARAGSAADGVAGDGWSDDEWADDEWARTESNDIEWLTELVDELSSRR